MKIHTGAQRQAYGVQMLSSEPCDCLQCPVDPFTCPPSGGQRAVLIHARMGSFAEVSAQSSTVGAPRQDGHHE